MTRNLNRRALLATGAMAGVGAAWTSLSDSWSARFLRARMAEFGQDVAPPPHTPTPAAWNDNAVTLAWLGHATVLVNFYGLRLITDPVLFTRIGVDLGIGSLGPQRLVPLRGRGRCAARNRPGAGIARALRSPRHAFAGSDPRPAGRGDGGWDGRPATAAWLRRRPRAPLERDHHGPDTARRGHGAGARSEALGRASRARHPSRLQRLGPRTRRAAAADRRRHREHGGVPRPPPLRTVRGGGDADRRLQSVDQQPLHPRAGGGDGRRRRRPVVRAGAPPVVQLEPRAGSASRSSAPNGCCTPSRGASACARSARPWSSSRSRSVRPQCSPCVSLRA